MDEEETEEGEKYVEEGGSSEDDDMEGGEDNIESIDWDQWMQSWNIEIFYQKPLKFYFSKVFESFICESWLR